MLSSRGGMVRAKVSGYDGAVVSGTLSMDEIWERLSSSGCWLLERDSLSCFEGK